jgi:hypothetical protein
MNRTIQVIRGGVALAAVGWLVLTGTAVAGGEKAYPRDPARVFVHPVPLSPADELTDGASGERIAIKEQTSLVWVDLYPNARYSHPTQYILVSASGTRVIDGSWWPVLNGKPLFRDAKTASADAPAK